MFITNLGNTHIPSVRSPVMRLKEVIGSGKSWLIYIILSEAHSKVEAVSHLVSFLNPHE